MEDFADIAAQVMYEIHGLDKSIGKKRYLETSGAPFHEQIEEIFPADKKNSQAVRDFEERKKITYFERPLFFDTCNTLNQLRNSGIKTVVASNNFQELVDLFVEKTAMEFDLVLGFKPNFAKGEAHFAFIESHFDSSRDSMLFVGDSLHDAERSIACNVDFIGKTGTFTKADFHNKFPGILTIDNLSELLKIVQL